MKTASDFLKNSVTSGITVGSAHFYVNVEFVVGIAMKRNNGEPILEISMEGEFNTQLQLPFYVNFISGFSIQIGSGVGFIIKGNKGDGHDSLLTSVYNLIAQQSSDSAINNQFKQIIDRYKLYTFGGEFDYMDGLPAYEIGIEFNARSWSLSDFKNASLFNWSDSLATINNALNGLDPVFFIQQRKVNSLSFNISNVSSLKSILLSNIGNARNKLEFYKDFGLRDFYSRKLKKSNDKEYALFVGSMLAWEYQFTTSEVAKLIHHTYNLILQLPLVLDCVKQRVEIDVSNNNFTDQLMTAVEVLYNFRTLMDCIADNQTIRKEIIDIFQLFEDKNNSVHFTFLNSVSFYTGARAGDGLKVRLEVGGEAAFFYQFSIGVDDIINTAEAMFNWLNKKYLETIDNI